MNQKDLIKYGLIALGAYLIYEYIRKNGGLSGILGTTAAGGATPPLGATPTTLLPGKTPPPVTGQVPPAIGTQNIVNGATYQWNGTAWILVKAAEGPANPPPTPPPVPPPAPVVLISQQMLKAAGGASNLNMDQWCFYYTAATGQGCPVDPGAIDPSVYAGAGIEDRTTPTDIGTWLAIMQNQAPQQLGLTGLGARYTPAWLM